VLPPQCHPRQFADLPRASSMGPARVQADARKAARARRADNQTATTDTDTDK